MEKNEIKKVLYKEKPIAKFIQYGKAEVYGENTHKAYETTTNLGVHVFSVPISEMGENEFENEISAQLLIRWLV